MFSLVRRDIDFAGSQSPRETELTRNALNTMSRVDVLNEADLVASCTSLTRDNSGVGKEVFPDLWCD